MNTYIIHGVIGIQILWTSAPPPKKNVKISTKLIATINECCAYQSYWSCGIWKTNITFNHAKINIRHIINLRNPPQFVIFLDLYQILSHCYSQIPTGKACSDGISCQHGGSCRDTGSPGFQCHCTRKYNGEFCENGIFRNKFN